MGTHDGLKTRGLAWCGGGALGAALLLLAVAVAPAAAASSPCRPAVQYWDEARGRCRDCSPCDAPGHVVLRPCHVHQDALCGHWRDLNIDWSWLRTRGRGRETTTEGVVAAATEARRAHHRGRAHASHDKRPWAEAEEDEPVSGERSDVDATALKEPRHRFHKHHKHKNNSSSSAGSHKHHGKHHRGHHHHPHHSSTASPPRQHHSHTFRPPESAAQLRAVDPSAEAMALAAVAAGPPELKIFEPRPPPPPPPEPFSSAEALVWDWQVAVLALAVLGCVLFFIAAAAYGIRQIRRDVRRTVDAESLSATLSLMVPEITSELTEHCTLDGCNINQCLCMEQLLVRKQDEPSESKGNVYIDRGSSKSRV